MADAPCMQIMAPACKHHFCYRKLCNVELIHYDTISTDYSIDPVLQQRHSVLTTVSRGHSFGQGIRDVDADWQLLCRAVTEPDDHRSALISHDLNKHSVRNMPVARSIFDATF